MEENLVKWVGARTVDPPEPLLISSVIPGATRITAKQTQASIGTAILYTVPVGADYLYITNFSLGGCGTATGLVSLDIYDTVPVVVANIAEICVFTRLPFNVSQPVIPSFAVPPTYTVRLTSNILNLDAHGTIHGYLTPYTY